MLMFIQKVYQEICAFKHKLNLILTKTISQIAIAKKAFIYDVFDVMGGGGGGGGGD